MKYIFIFLLFLLSFSTCFSQVWTQQQLDSANTGVTQNQLSQAEKDAIMYLNLARLYPRQFAIIEVENYFGTAKFVDYVKDSKFRQSLIADLTKREPIPRLFFDSSMFSFAKCFSQESGERGIVGHTRINCTAAKGNVGECCSYGMETGKDIILQLLIDDKVPGLGHRLICLNEKYLKIGVSVSAHKVWGTCAVLDFSY